MQSARFAASGTRQATDLEASESKPMRRAFRFEHGGCQPVHVVLTGTVSAALEQRLSQGAVAAGFIELRAGSAETDDVFPQTGLLLSVQLSGCAQAQHAVFELASALCRDLPPTQVVSVRFLTDAARSKVTCGVPSPNAVAKARRRHAQSRLHA